jgi:predicted nucleic acid-binding protein
MKARLYVETTIFGYLTARTSRDIVTAGHQKITKLWWDSRRQAFELFCSELVVEEISTGSQEEAEQRLSQLPGIAILAFSPEAVSLAKALLKRKALPAHAENDALHVALAAVNDMEFMLTWNCRHLANASLRSLIERVCKKGGYRCPIICTPEQLMEK